LAKITRLPGLFEPCIGLGPLASDMSISRYASSEHHDAAPDGPIQRYFRAQVQIDFFRSRFDDSGELMVFVSGMLSRANNAVIQNRIRRLSAEFSELHHEDLGLPLSERFGTSLLLAVRPWTPEFFKRFEKRPSAKRMD
jgi:hypothetical protein